VARGRPWSAGCEDLQAVDGCAPRPSGWESEPRAPAAADDDPPGSRERPQPQLARLPAAGGAGEGTMTRIRFGQPARSSRPVTSATHAPARRRRRPASTPLPGSC
jgi:hypothetical protein